MRTVSPSNFSISSASSASYVVVSDGNLNPAATGLSYTVPAGSTAPETPKRPHLRLVR